MDRILQYVIGNMNQGGLENNLMQVYRRIDKVRFQFDFIVHDVENYYAKEIQNLGGRIYSIPFKSENYKKSISEFSDILNDHSEYRIIHFHTSYAIIYPEVVVAKKMGRAVIVHAHASAGEGFKKKIINAAFKNQLDSKADIKIAVSNSAAKWQFSDRTNIDKNYILLQNSIDTRKFAFNQKVRKNFRIKYQIEDRYVIGTTGRLVHGKNIGFLIQILNEIRLKIPNIKLMIVGDGPDMNRLKGMCDKELSDYIIFTGKTELVNEFLQIFDVFCFPSLYEGLGISVLEAICSGLPCVINETLPSELSISDNVIRLPLKSDIWIKTIESLYGNENLDKRKDLSEMIESNGFGIENNVKNWENLYTDLQIC